MKFQAGVSKFQFKVSFSTSKFPIRVSKLGARLNRFDGKRDVFKHVFMILVTFVETRRQSM